MSEENKTDSIEEAPKPTREEVANEIPGFFVSWLNGEGEREEGPLSLLWKLIESYRVDIFDISLVRITEDFMEFVRRAGEIQIELASPFIVMGARLLYYKSRALLPDPGFEDNESDSRLPPELIQQLLEYRKYQMASERLKELDDITSGMYGRTAPIELPPETEDEKDDWLELDVVDLIRAYSDMVQRQKAGQGADEKNYEVSIESFSVEDKVSYIRALLQDAVSFVFFDLFENPESTEKGEVIVTFLAILEMTKLSEIIIKQHRVFDEIRVFKKSSIVR